MTTELASHVSRGSCNLIAGQWRPIPGDALFTVNPAFPEHRIFACSPRVSDVHEACNAARAALPAWSTTPRERRFAVLRRFAQIAKERQALMAGLLCDEIGKVMWESKQEAALLSGKVDITLDEAPEGGLRRVTDFEFALSPSRVGRCTFKPHGVMGVIGPFNFPAHLPNGHIVPALAMGNTIVFKPSDKAMAVGQQLAGWFDEALRAEGINIPGVLNLVQGGADVASAVVSHPELDAIAFTGSWPVGKKILQANLDRPGRIIALELGGSNPSVYMPDCDLRLAAIELARSAFATTGQRCTCTRRAIVHRDIADKLIPAVCKMASAISVGHARATNPVFMGPLNNARARQDVLDFQSRAEAAGAEILVRSAALDTPGTNGTSKGFFLTPSVIRVDRFTASDAIATGGAGFDAGCDQEIFGPLLRVSIVNNLDEAIAQSNATRYGLAAAIFTKDTNSAARFVSEVRAGCINVNTGTAGASSKLPFGGLGWSGNHRPAGSFALDYCATPVASMLESSDAAAVPEGMTLYDGWLK
jgi:succinylglutamic semialdehyde dehydrogenase